MRVRGGFAGLLAALLNGRVEINGHTAQKRRLDPWTEKRQREAERERRQLARRRDP